MIKEKEAVLKLRFKPEIVIAPMGWIMHHSRKYHEEQEKREIHILKSVTEHFMKRLIAQDKKMEKNKGKHTRRQNKAHAIVHMKMKLLRNGKKYFHGKGPRWIVNAFKDVGIWWLTKHKLAVRKGNELRVMNNKGHWFRMQIGGITHGRIHAGRHSHRRNAHRRHLILKN